METADLVDRDGRTIFGFGRIDWTDLDHNGDVIYAKDGRLFRLPKFARARRGATLTPIMVADL